MPVNIEVSPDNLKDIIKKSLEVLKPQNTLAYEILSAKIEEGFFEMHQTRSNLDRLTHQLIDTVTKSE
jgi:hypothetical protein